MKRFYMQYNEYIQSTILMIYFVSNFDAEILDTRYLILYIWYWLSCKRQMCSIKKNNIDHLCYQCCFLFSFGYFVVCPGSNKLYNVFNCFCCVLRPLSQNRQFPLSCVFFVDQGTKIKEFRKCATVYKL